MIVSWSDRNKHYFGGKPLTDGSRERPAQSNARAVCAAGLSESHNSSLCSSGHGVSQRFSIAKHEAGGAEIAILLNS